MTFDALPSAPVFPAQPLDVRTELNLSGTWTDISLYVQQDPVTIGRGHPDESTQTTAATCGLTLDNSDGRFSATYPAGPYYGSLIRNVPIRVSIPEGASYLRLENDGATAASSYASCPDSAGVSITGDMDFQIDLTLDNWNAGLILASKWAETSNERTWLLLLNDTGTLTFVISTAGTSGISMISSVAPAVPPLLRQCLRVTYAVATGVCTFYTAPAGNLSGATWTQLGATVTSGSTSNLFDSTAPVQAGWCSDAAAQTGSTPGMTGKIHALRLLSGIAGTVKASPDFTAATAGATSFTDAESNTWSTAGTSEVSNRKYRFHGEVPQWPQSSAPSGTNIKVALSAGGLLRRTGRAQIPVNSALYRFSTRLTGALAPVAYWPGEDAAGATRIASGLGGPAMTISGSPQLASFSSFAATAPIPVLGSGSGQGATFTGQIPAYTGGSDNVLRFLLAVPSGGDVNGGIIARLATNGTVRYMTLTYGSGSGGTLALAGFDQNGAQLFSSGATAFNVNGAQVYCAISLQTSGGNLNWEVQTVAPGAGAAGTASGTLSSATIGNMTGLLVNPKGTLNATAAGQWMAQSKLDTSFFADISGPLIAWQGETAGNRFSRLCSEEGIAFRSRGRLADTVAMGTQTLQTLTALLQECADADRGVWTEPRQCLGWGYRTRVTLGNQTPAVVWDYAQDHLEYPLEPTEDDQIIQNDVTVTNTDGSSSRQIQATGSLSIQAPPNGVGRYDTSISVNLASDSQLDSEAGFILHTGTVAEPRYPAINVDLGNTSLASLYYATLDADLGDRVQINNPPVNLPPGVIDQLIQGTSETLFFKTLTESYAGVPASPWNVAYADDLVYGRADTDGSTLAAAATSTATSLSVATYGAGTAPGTLNPAVFQTLLTVPVAPGIYLVSWTVTLSGTVGSPEINNFQLGVLGAGFPFGGFVAQSVNAGAAGSYVQTAVQVTVPAGGGPFLLQAKGNTPTTGATYGGSISVFPSTPLWTTTAGDFPFDIQCGGERMTVTNITGTSSPQTFTVTRSVNGVVKAQAALTDIRLFTPTIISL